MNEKSCCCNANDYQENTVVETVSTTLSFNDYIGAWKVRWGIGRMSYTIEPGLYSVGKPDDKSPVLVSGNYKLTFDVLRKNLDGINCWLLILDTKGINVWCAAGKGTFGTDELVYRIEKSGLDKYVSHKNLVVPQLGATGVSAHEVKRRSGYHVNYGPVRAEDIKEYINTGQIATKDMRVVKFTLRDRLVLTPLQLVQAAKYTLPIFGGLMLSNQLARRPFEKQDIVASIGAILTGAVITPALLPFIPGKAFALKGWLTGLIWTAGCLGLSKRFKKGNRILSAGELLLLPAVSSFIAMDYTGSSTYTSPTGVQKEMKKALPFIIGAAAVGGALTLGVHLLGGRKKK